MDVSLQISNYSLDKKIEASFANLTLSDIELTEKKDEINSILSNSKIEDLNNIKNIIPQKRKKLKKEELNNIPIPIFSCIYCSNEKISFNHMIQTILEKKYFLLTSIYDIRTINKLISNSNMANLEYIKYYYKYKDSHMLLNKNANPKKDKMNYNINNNIMTYSTCTGSNSTLIKFKFEDLMKTSTPKKNKNSKNVHERKIKKKDIIWDYKYYNIWNPIPEPIYCTKNFVNNNNTIINNKMNMKIISKLKIEKKEFNKKKYKKYIRSNRNEKMTINKSFQKLFIYTFNPTKKSSKNKNINKFNNKHTITKYITKSNSKSKNKINNIIVNITPIKKINLNHTNNKNNNNKLSSQKNILLKTINISFNNKIQKKYLNIKPINIFNTSNNFSTKKIFPQKSSFINNKKFLTKNISKKFSRNNTHNKLIISKEKTKKSISPDFLNNISHEKKIVNKNNKNKSKNIEIFINNIK